jgi:hypothetical protein
MANPNIVNVTTIRGRTIQIEGNSGSSGSFGAWGSDEVVKVNTVLVCNVGSSAVTFSLGLYDTDPLAFGATSGYIVRNVSIPVGSTLSILDAPIYLTGTHGISYDVAGANVHITVSYEEIS